MKLQDQSANDKCLFASLLAALVLLASAAAFAGNVGGQAAVSLLNASASLSQTSDTSWKLEKTGELNTGNQTVTWTITATQGATVGGHLVVNGFMTVVNTGSKRATIGNIIVNLQAKSGSSWVTQSSDIADATHGDAATSAYIDPHASSENKSSFAENSASGQLQFMDANDNTVFSLKPQKTVAPSAMVNLLFAAEFDNNVLKLSNGTSVRAEVIVSFGNASSTPPSAPRVDINGNGVIDPDEAWVRSIPARLTLTVPAEVAGNQSVTLTDTAQDIAATGTVTFSNATFSLGATSGTVTVSYNGGASGGKLTNCAHLKSAGSTVTVGGFQFPNVNGIDLEACDTQTIGAAGTAGWKDGDVVTYIQASWAGDPGSVVSTNYNHVYAGTGGIFEVGGGFTMDFTTAAHLLAYLPAVGTNGALDANLVDPTSSSAGGFGGEVVALKLNVDFSDAGLVVGTAGVKFGDLTLCGFSTLPALNGQSLRQFLAIVNTLLGGGTSTYTITNLDPVAANLNASFGGGTVTTFAQQHLFNGACPAGPWKTGDLTTYTQTFWSDDATASGILSDKYNTVYGSNFGVVEVGIPGTGGFSMRFSDPSSVLAYLPASGTAAALDADVVNPTSTSSGIFGGDVLALQFNIDFSDQGFLSGTAGIAFGNLTLCALTATPNLNGLTVRQFRDQVNTALGGGTASYDIATLQPITFSVDASFGSGTPSTFAQQHLVNGACQ